MKGKIFGVLVLMLCFLNHTSSGEEIKYGFTKGAIYSYSYTRQDSSKASAPVIAPQKNSDKTSFEFSVKSIGFQDNAFILDIGNSDATYRRYLSSNGALVGSPTEDQTALPFFITFPEGDWRVGSTVKLVNEVNAFGQTIPVNWNMTLASIDSLKILATINFFAIFNVPDNRNYSRKLTLQGVIVFNMAEGVVHKADWETKYSSKLINKELAITRSLWEFQKQTNHSLSLTGVQK